MTDLTPTDGQPEHRVNARLSRSQHEWLTQYAQELRLSRGEVIRMLIEQEKENNQ